MVTLFYELRLVPTQSDAWSFNCKCILLGRCLPVSNNGTRLAESVRRHQGERQVIVIVGRLAFEVSFEASCESRLPPLIVKEPSSLHLAWFPHGVVTPPLIGSQNNNTPQLQNLNTKHSVSTSDQASIL